MLIVAGILFITSGTILAFMFGPIAVLAGAYVITTTSGIKIDPSTKRFQEYTSYFGLKQGKWLPLDKYTDIAILKFTGTSTVRGRANQAISSTESVFKLYLLTKNHRKRILVKEYETASEAKEQARELSGVLGMNFTAYAPERKSRPKR